MLLASARHDNGAILAPLQAVVMTVNAVVLAVAWCWDPFWLTAPWVALVVLWNEGRKRGPVPTWLATASEADVDITIDEHTIGRALLALRIPQITAALKVAPLQFITTARKDGRGTHAVIRLPAGVTAEKIAPGAGTSRPGCIGGPGRSGRPPGPRRASSTCGSRDKGALAEGAGPHPLLESGAVDVFKGVPFGKTLRGEPILAPIIGRNSITGGMPDQGKSSAARTVMAGAALDPSVELRIWVPDANFDFEAFKPRCSRYVMGAEDAKIEQIVADLRDLDGKCSGAGSCWSSTRSPR